MPSVYDRLAEFDAQPDQPSRQKPYDPFESGGRAMADNYLKGQAAAEATRIKTEQRDAAMQAKNEQRTALAQGKAMETAMRADPISDEISTITRDRANIRLQREAGKANLKQFMEREGADFFELDPTDMTGRKHAKNPDGSPMIARRFTEDLYQKRLLAQQTGPEAERARAEVAATEREYRLKKEKFDRITVPMKELDALEATHVQRLGVLGGIRQQRDSQRMLGAPVDGLAQPMAPELAQPTAVPAQPEAVATQPQGMTPAAIVQAHAQMKKAEAAGDAATVDALRAQIEAGMGGLDEARQQRVMKVTKDPTFWGEVGRNAKDMAMSFGSGANSILKMAGDLYGLTTGNMGNALSTAGKEGAEFYDSRKSPEIQAAEKARQAAIESQPDELGKAWAFVRETVSNPALMAGLVTENIPNAVGAGGAGAAARVGAEKLLLRGAATAAAKQAAARKAASVGVGVAVGAGAAMQGADVGADNYDELVTALDAMPAAEAAQIPEIADLMERGATLDAAKLSLALTQARKTGVLAGALSVAAQNLPGAKTIERTVVGGAAKRGVGRLASAGVGAAGEAVSEVVEEVGGKMISNVEARPVDPERPIMQGTGETAAQAALAAGVMGGAAGALNVEPPAAPAAQTPPPAATPTPPAPAAPTAGAAPTSTPPAQPAPAPSVPQPQPPASNAPTVTATPPAPVSQSPAATAAPAPAQPEADVTLNDQASKTFEVTNTKGETATVDAVRESEIPSKLPQGFGEIKGIKRVASSLAPTLEGEKINKEWTAFAPESKTLGIPRAEMPQVKAEHRGALTQFLKARDILSEETEVRPGELKPTQAEYSPGKVEKARGFKGGDRAILVSSDNHVVDGHHQWMAKLADAPDEFMRVIKLDAPIQDVLEQMKQFPSVENAKGATASKAGMVEPQAGVPTPSPEAAAPAPAPATPAPASLTPGGAQSGQAVRGSSEATSVPPAPVSPQPAATSAKPQKSPTPPTRAPAPAAAKPSTPKPPVVARGANKPAIFIKAVAQASGIKAKDKATRFLQDFAPRLHKANPKAFEDMEVHVLNQTEWAANERTGSATPDSAAAYNPETNTLYFNSSKMKLRDGEDAISAVVHEAGHFAEKFALGEEFTQREWEKLTHEQRIRAKMEYDQGAWSEGDVDGIKKDRRARAEWVAMQFARVVRGETDQMAPTMLAKLKAHLEMVRELVRKWIGDKSLTTKELDAKILEILGRNEAETKPAEPVAQPAAPAPAVETKLAPKPGAISDELKALGDALFGTPAAPGANPFGQKFDPAKIETANKFVGLLVREKTDVRSRAALAKFISDNFPKARPFSESVFRIMGGFTDLDESGTFADAYAAIDKPTATAETTPSNERASPERSSVDAGERVASPVEQYPQEPESGSAATSPGVASEGMEPGERIRNDGNADAGQPGEQRGRGDGVDQSGQGRSDVGQPDAAAAEQPTGSGQETDAGQRGGDRPASDVGAKPAAGSQRAELKPEDQNHRIGVDDTLIPGGDKSKARANISALKLLRALESENRNPTPEEKKVLAQYVGWGGLPNVFNQAVARLRELQKQGRLWNDAQQKELATWEKDWGKLYDELKALLTPEEYAAAARSTLNAHYTSRDVIAPMWGIVRRLGFKGGTALETSAGIGHFLGLQPQDMADKTKWKAVELDSVTGRMLSKLYPQAQTQVKGFQDAKIPDHSVDLIIGNVPFAKDGPIDSRYPRLSLHNYFFARSMDALKPGGLMVAITSNSTMDNGASKAAREWLAERADLVGAIRLPNNAFKKNAGTEVTTDIVILRKRGGGAFAGAQNWINAQEIPTYDGKQQVAVNEYFARNPEMMLGRMSLEGTMYGGNEPALLPTPGADLTKQLQDATAKLPEAVIGTKAAVAPAVVTAEGEQATGKEGSVVMKDGKPYQIENGTLKVPAWAKVSNKAAIAKSYTALRDHLKESLALMQNDGASEKAIEAARKKLNEIYDKHVAKFGAINERPHSFLEDDPELPLVQALEDQKTVLKETVVKSGKFAGQKRQTFEKSFTKATIFEKRTIFPRSEPTSADTIADAISQSLAYRNEIDPSYVATLRGISEEDAQKQLRAEPDIYVDPKTGKFESSDAYLSGFVREKLEQAKRAAENDPSYQKNVDALEKNQPRWLSISEISYRLGSSWLPSDLIARFLRDKLQVNARVDYTEQTGHWQVLPMSGASGAVNATTYGTTRMGGHELIADALNLKSPVVYDEILTPDGKKREKNNQETLMAQQKQQELQQLFKDYVKDTTDTHANLEKIYNERFNGVKLREFEGPKWDHYPNASHEIKLRQHQKDVTARILQESTLLAHSVGTGKTFIMITAAQEMRRLGLAKKPMIVTQNATTQQFAASYKKLYPTARILVPSRKQREAANRKRLMSQIATGDYDAVIIPQSFLNQLPDDPKRLASFIQSEIDEMESAKIAAKQSEGEKSPKVKDLEKAKAKLEEKLKKLADRKTDDTVTFEQLGVDALMVDEAHAYKKLEFTTQMDNIKGLDRGASERGLGLYMKTRWIQEKNNGKNVVLATGTPVSNTIAEAWNMLRFTRPDLLTKYGVEKFDDFAGAFGDTVTNIEQTAGGGFKQVTRFAKYTNGPELIAMFHSAADVVLKEDINLPGLPAVKNGQPTTVQIKQTPLLKQYIGVLRDRLAAFERMSGREKRANSHIPLVVFGLAKKATLDLRLIDSSLPDESTSKLNETVRQTLRIYKESDEVKGTQLIFADLFQSPDGQFNLYHEIRDKLVKQGIPKEQIAIISEAKTDAQRERIFEAVKAGEIRVMLGSTEKMGVGVNVQDRLIALHHMDAPARPMDIEQRNGRIVRQGNQNPIVELLNYGVENTLDATLYQRLAIKQKFINQIMRGDIEGRNFEDAADEVSMTFEEQMAAFSGNPLAMKKVAIEGEVRRLESLKQGHLRQLSTTRAQLESAKRDLANKEAYQPKVEAASKRALDLFAGETTGAVEGKTYADRKTLAAALDENMSKFLADQKERIGTQIQSGEWSIPAATVKVNSLPIQLTLHIPTNENGLITDESRKPFYTFESVLEGGIKLNGSATTGGGLLLSLSHGVHSLETRASDNKASIARVTRDITEMAGFITQPFQQEAQLQKAREDASNIERELEASSKTEEQKPSDAPAADDPLSVVFSKSLETPEDESAPKATAPTTAATAGGIPLASYRLKPSTVKSDRNLVGKNSAGVEFWTDGRIMLKGERPARVKADVPIARMEGTNAFDRYTNGADLSGAPLKILGIERGARVDQLWLSNGKAIDPNYLLVARLAYPTAELFPNGESNSVAIADPKTKEFLGVIMGMQIPADKVPAWAKGTMLGTPADTATETGDLLGTPPEVQGTPAQEAVLSKVNGTLEDKRTLTEKFRDYLDALKDYVNTELRQKLVDSFASIKRLERANFGANANLDASVSAYKAARLTKNLPSVMDYLMNHGTLAYTGGGFSMKPGGRGLMQIFKPLIDAGTLRLWEGYATAYRANRLLAEGKESNFGRTYDPATGKWTWDATKAQAEIDELLALGTQYPEFETVRQGYVDFQKSILDVAEGAGLINAASRALWDKSDYVPFYRITETLDGTGPRKKGGIADQRSGIKKLKGGAAPVAIMENIVRNIETMVDASFKNVAMQRVADLASGNSDMLVQIPYKAVPFKASVAEVVDTMEKAGIDTTNLALTPAELAEFVKFWRMKAPKGKDVVSVMIDGKPIYYRVKDAALLRSVQSMGPKTHSWWMNMLMAPKKLLTGAVTLDPAFMAANTIRDSFSAWVISDAPIKPGIDTAKGFLKSLRNDPSKLAVMAAGGGSGHYNNLQGGKIRDYIRQLTPADRKSFLDSIVDTAAKAAKVYADIGRATENANRIAIADSVRKGGGTDAEAAFQALDIMDFGLRGDSSLLNFFLDTVPFMNARIQGLYKLGRASGIGEGTGVTKYLPHGKHATYGAIITGATLALLGKNWDDDRYWALPEWERDIYYHFWIGDQHVRIPKPFEVGQIFSTVPERMFEYLGKTGDGKLLGKRLLTMVTDTFAMNPLPQVLKPAAERAMNLNTFTGGKIISRGDEFKTPENQFSVNTSETVREIAQAMPDSAPEWMRSPKTLEHFVRGYFGSIGMYALTASDAMTRAAGKYPSEPAMQRGDFWVMKRFAPSSDLRETKYVSQFYDLHQEVTGVVRQIKELQKTDMGQAKALAGEKADLLRYAPRSQQTYEALQVIRKQEEQVRASNATPERKREQLAALADRRNQTAQTTMQASPRRPWPLFNPFASR